MDSLQSIFKKIKFKKLIDERLYGFNSKWHYVDKLSRIKNIFGKSSAVTINIDKINAIEVFKEVLNRK